MKKTRQKGIGKKLIVYRLSISELRLNLDQAQNFTESRLKKKHENP